jgi:hypothetical protein
VIAKRINSKALLGVAGLLTLLGIVGALMGPGREPDAVLSARIGDVAWNHEQHARMESIPNCQVCHHQEREGTLQPRPCSECHRVEDDLDLLIQADLFMDLPERVYEGDRGPVPMVAYHAKCIGCHEAMAEGPIICRDCHAPGSAGAHGRVDWNHFVHSRKLGIDAAGGDAHSDCASCHHHDPDAEGDGDYRPCGVCHQPAVVLGQSSATGLTGFADAVEAAQHANAKHGECAVCHLVTNPENDGRTCSDCHQPWEFDLAERELPNLEQAIHERCRDCHHPESETLTDRMPTSCAGCHQPDPSWISDPEIGNILWSHKRHGMYRDLECDACHHQDLPDEPHQACGSCHAAGLFGSPPLRAALSERCIGCHREREAGIETWSHLVTEEPTVEFFEITTEEGSFWWNHHAHALGDSFSCQECHHNILRQDGEYVTTIRTGGGWPDSARAIQSCENCHGETGSVVGSVAGGTEAPTLPAAYRAVCLECHQRLGGGPQSWEEFFVEPEINWEAILEELPAANEEDSR